MYIHSVAIPALKKISQFSPNSIDDETDKSVFNNMGIEVLHRIK